MLRERKNIIIATALVTLAIVASALFFYNKNRWGAIRTMTDAMNTGRPLQCTFADSENAGEQAQVNVEGPKFRLTTQKEGAQHPAVFDGGVFYLWSANEKNGVRMTRACAEKPEQADKNPEAVLRKIEEVRCRESEPVDLSVPAEVIFVDPCERSEESVDAYQRLELEERSWPTMQKLPEQYE
jgi:hypothetical protein